MKKNLNVLQVSIYNTEMLFKEIVEKYKKTNNIRSKNYEHLTKMTLVPKGITVDPSSLGTVSGNETNLLAEQNKIIQDIQKIEEDAEKLKNKIKDLLEYYDSINRPKSFIVRRKVLRMKDE